MKSLNRKKLTDGLIVVICSFFVAGTSLADVVFDFVDGSGFDAAGIGATMAEMDGTTNVVMETVDIIGQDGSKASEGKGHLTNIYGALNTLGINDANVTGTEYSHFDSNEGWVFKFSTDVNLVGINFSSLDAGDEMTMSSSAFSDFVFEDSNAHSLSNVFVSAGTSITIQNTGSAGTIVRINDLTVTAVPEPATLGLFLSSAVGIALVRRFLTA